MSDFGKVAERATPRLRLVVSNADRDHRGAWVRLDNASELPPREQMSSWMYTTVRNTMLVVSTAPDPDDDAKLAADLRLLEQVARRVALRLGEKERPL